MGGFVKAVTKPIKPIFQTTKNVVFGKPDKVNFIPPERMIMKPSAEERLLSGTLIPQAGESGRIADKLLTREINLLNPAIIGLQQISSGNLPAPFQRAINRAFTEQLGGILNQTANRGIINSSITKEAIADALQRAVDMQVNYLPTAAKLSILPIEFIDRTRRGLLSFPANLYTQMMSARFGVRGMPVVTRGSGGLLGAIAGGVGQGLGMGIGSWGVKKLLG